ncbi:MAG: hypothetical protein N2204_05200 [Anaerolineae bacterium]|nr:hypothetical protein [Anaerolineae bacterium]
MPFFLPPLIGGPRNARVQFDVFAATERWQQRRGARVPWGVYRGDRRWTPPLRAQWPRAIDPARNPLLAETEHALFLAEARSLSLGDVVAGRLVAWASAEEGVGYFGAFEAINDPNLTEALFSAAETWFFEHVPGLEVVRGPVSLDPLSPSGLLADGFDARPAAFLPYSPPYYPELLMREEFELQGQWQAYALDLRAAAASQTQGRSAWDLRILGPQDWSDVASPILDLHRQMEDSLGAWQVVFPLLAGETDPRFSLEAQLLIRWLRPRALAVTAWDMGELIGAVIGVPDISVALRRADGRLLPFGWLPYRLAVRRAQRLRIFPATVAGDHSGCGVEHALYSALAEAAVAKGFDAAVVGPFESAEQIGNNNYIKDAGDRPLTADRSGVFDHSGAADGIGRYSGARVATEKPMIASAHAMAALGARVIQTYRMCEKRY